MLSYQPPQRSATPPPPIMPALVAQTAPSSGIKRTRSANPRLVTTNRKVSASSTIPPPASRSTNLLPPRAVESSSSGRSGRRTQAHSLPQNGEDAARILSTVLSIRGISSRTESYPPLDRPDAVTLPMHYIASMKEAIHSYGTSSASHMSSEEEEEEEGEARRPNYLLMSNSGGWTSGNSTERSSLFSWADDEFDKQAGRMVHRMFHEIDNMLFEGHKDAAMSVQLQNECKEWNSRFPHLRILGQQLITPDDLGYQFVATSQRPATVGELVDIGENEYPSYSSQDSQGLKISGRHLEPIDPEVALGSGHDPQPQCLADMQEEIFESDGVIEEYFAYDRSKSWEDDESHANKRYHAPRRKGFPPLTPNACVQNSIYSQAFDVVWTEVVGWIRLLLHRHWQVLSEAKKYSSQDDTASSMSILHPIVPTFDLSYSLYPFGSGRGLMDGHSSKLAPMGSGLRLNTAPSLNISLVDRQNLTGVMTISSKAIHSRPNDRETRAPSVLGEELQGTPLHHMSLNRPGSNLNHINRSNRPTSVRTTDNYSYRLTSARGRGRLRPIDRARTPHMEGIITGKKLATVSDRVGSPSCLGTSPPHHWSRSAALPPIETVQENQLKLDPHSSQVNPSSNKGLPKSRIASAVTDDRALRLKDRSATFTSESRPNTTHTFRSDTPFGMVSRRSSTPQSFSLFKSAAAATAAAPTTAGNHGIMSGITGISIGIPGSSSHLEQYGGSTQTGYFKVL